MTDTTTNGPEPTKDDVSLPSFVSKAIDSYKGRFASFIRIAKSGLVDGDKLHQASMHLSDISTLIAADFQRIDALAEGDAGLCFNIAHQLISDSRVGKALGLTDKLWEDILSLEQFKDSAEYNGFVALITNRDQQKKETNKLCC